MSTDHSQPQHTVSNVASQKEVGSLRLTVVLADEKTPVNYMTYWLTAEEQSTALEKAAQFILALDKPGCQGIPVLGDGLLEP